MLRMGSIMAASTALVLGACVDTVVVHEPVFSQGYYEGAYEYAASKGEVRTVVDGNPFNVDKRSFDATVTQQMTGANYGPRATFTTRASPNTLQAFKVVMAFNAPPGFATRELCADGAEPLNAPPSNRGVSVLAAFCQYDTLLSEAEGYVLAAGGPNDPTFRNLVRQVTGSLFPVDDRHEIGGDGPNT